MTAVSRVTYQVRIPNPADTTGLTYIDVEVLASITFIGSDGLEHCYDFGGAKPCIIDATATGDYGNKGDATSASRISHIIRVTNPDDSTQYFDIEILDAFCVLGSNGDEELHEIKMSDLAGALGTVIDTTGSGLGSDPADPSRISHVVKIVQTNQEQTDFDGVLCACDNTDDNKNEANDSLTGQFTCIAKTDVVSYLGSNGQENLYEQPYNEDKIDATQWTTDSKGDKAPPKNTDPNPYIVWPANVTIDNNGWLGKKGMDGSPLSQGPLWWIKRIGTPTSKPPPHNPLSYDVTVHLTWLAEIGFGYSPLGVPLLLVLSDGTSTVSTNYTIPGTSSEGLGGVSTSITLNGAAAPALSLSVYETTPNDAAIGDPLYIAAAGGQISWWAYLTATSNSGSVTSPIDGNAGSTDLAPSSQFPSGGDSPAGSIWAAGRFNTNVGNGPAGYYLRVPLALSVDFAHNTASVGLTSFAAAAGWVATLP